MKRIMSAGIAAALLLSAAPDGHRFELTIDNIMRGPGLVGYEPSDVRWSGDGQRIYFRWKQASDPLERDPDTYVVNRDGSGLRKLSDEEARNSPPSAGDFTRDRKRIVYAREGDIWVYDNTTDQAKRITQTAEAETNPHWLRDGRRIYFTRSNNLYVLSLEDASVRQLTDIRPPGSQPPGPGVAHPEPQKGTASQEFVKKEERDLIEVVKERAEHREEEEAKRKREHPIKPFNLQPRQTVRALQLSPDEKYVIASVAERPDKAKSAVIPNFVTESGYTETTNSREKVGDVQEQTRLAILSAETGDVKWVDPGLKATPPEGGVKTGTGKEVGETGAVKPPTETQRELQLYTPVWSEDGTRAVLLARSADNKDRWIMALDVNTGKTRILEDIHDDAWVDGPGAFTLGWMKSDRDIYFQSERSGYSHLYTVPFEGGPAKQLTFGRWEVEEATLSKDKTRFFLVTSEADPGEHQVYEMSADGGTRVRLTTAPGMHTAIFSQDDHWFADIYSYTNKPPELYAQEAGPSAPTKKLTSSPAPEFWQYSWLDTPIVTYRARDGAMVRAHLYKPANFKQGGPAVIFVHGAGYLQNVHRGWSTYYHEYMFHHILMNRGYVVMDVDYRGSAGYGRDWRTAIYEHMGGKDLDDNIDAAHWLVTEQGVDPKRIGIYGGSYGGFITLMAMFTTPDVFRAGAALRPVTDWAHYNHPYTSNILNNPQSDPDAYRRSSPIYFAQNLKGALLICHGMVDTNVHFQDTVRLVQRLIELRKQNWELAVYPVENHSFVEPTSWADEYKRIVALFKANLK